MFLRTHAARGNETNRFSATYTLSDFPLLIGEILRRSERRSRSEEHTSELQSQSNLVCRLLLEKKKRHIFRPSSFAKCIGPIFRFVKRISSFLSRTPAHCVRTRLSTRLSLSILLSIWSSTMFGL